MPMLTLGIVDHPERYGNRSADVSSARHSNLSKHFAEQSTVLLVNRPDDEGATLLPLDDAKRTRIAIVGDADTVTGGGSGAVWSKYIVTITEGVLSRAGRHRAVQISLPQSSCNASGFMLNQAFQGFDLKGKNGSLQTPSAAGCCKACAQTPACHFWSWNGLNTTNCYLKDASASGHNQSRDQHISGPPPPPGPSPAPGPSPPRPPAPGPPTPTPGPPFTCQKSGVVEVCNRSVTFDSCGPQQCNETRNTVVVTPVDISAAVDVAKMADITLVSVATTATEGYDRDDLSLGEAQNQLVASVAAVCSDVVVLVRSPGAVEMPWINLSSVRAVVLQLLPGQESGHAAAAVLFGDVNPSGKLPLSFPRQLNETWLQSQSQYPGVRVGHGWESHYTEELEMGYRWYDSRNIQPLFEFGFGMSYTSWNYSSLSVETSPHGPTHAFSVAFKLTNVGCCAGAEVAQLYVGLPSTSRSPPKRLVNFSKIATVPNTSYDVQWLVSRADLAVWDPVTESWVMPAGSFDVYVGSSSRDVRCHTKISLKVDDPVALLSCDASSFMVNQSFQGNDLHGANASLLTDSPATCCNACAHHPECFFWSFDVGINTTNCYLKAVTANRMNSSRAGHISGPPPTPGPPPPSPGPPAPPPAPSPPMPSDWRLRLQTGWLLAGTAEPASQDLCPTYGNGFVAATVCGEGGTYLSGFYDGPCPDTGPPTWKSNQRASLPSPHHFTGVENATFLGMALDVQNATIARRFEQTNCTVELVYFAHRSFRHLLVMAISASNFSAETCVVVPIRASNHTACPRVQGQPEQLVCNVTTTPETPRQTPTTVAMYAHSSPSRIVLNESVPTLVLLTAFATNLEAGVSAATATEVAEQRFSSYTGMSLEALLQAHTDEWSKLWQADLQIGGNVSATAALRSSLYYVLSSVRADWAFGSSPGGLPSPSYHGHVL